MADAGATVAIAASALAGLTWYVRKFIQGYWFDQSCPDPDRSLVGRVALVTGANQGLGLVVATELAALGATVVLGCRSEARGSAAAEHIGRSTGSSSVSVCKLDLASQASIKAAAEEFQRKHDRLDILVLNAGVSGNVGSGLVWQTNYLGGFQLTEALLPLIERTAASAGEGADSLGCRIVAVSSGAHTRATIDFNDPFEPSGDGISPIVGAYGQSKLAQVMHMKELTRRLAEKGLGTKVIAVACTPGFVRTSMTSSSGVKQWLLFPLQFTMGRSQWRGAQVIKKCCIGKVTPGGYYSNCYEKPATGRGDIANDPQAQRRLWDLSQTWIGECRFP